MTLKPKGISQCECDCMISTCSDCFIRGYIKPTCENCHKDFNDGKCGCDDPKQHIMKGWVDNTKHIVKHTPKEKVIVRDWIDAHNKSLKESTRVYNIIWQGMKCRDCGKSFKVRGGRIDTCKKCTLKILDDPDKYSEND